MLYGRYQFSCVLGDDAVLPEFKGSTFRGIFGHSLKKVVCILKTQECDRCILGSKCIYRFVFEGEAGSRAKDKRPRIALPPHPYVIEPPEETKTDYRKGESFNFTIILFGKANDYLPYFVFAIQQMGDLGVGKRVAGRRARFTLEAVASGGKSIFRQPEGRLMQGDFAEDLDWPDPGKDGSGRKVNRLELRLLTPLRLKYENHLGANLPFHLLTRAMLRRIAALNTYHGSGEPPLDYRGLVQRAQKVRIRENRIRWLDWRRFSNRQDQTMLMGGLVGDVTYEGDLAEFMPLIEYCEKVHIGKQTTFGLGRIAAKREIP
ncbi:MAG TPA: CRISPR system precrRNA processing endoribonuclease RAMP protein Cas6 [Syntrophales bacterium]|nr:CRISPR system precrRNA processing endoribonuclease RAMP protein Cas6 [Syntrophales bacterium]